MFRESDQIGPVLEHKYSVSIVMYIDSKTLLLLKDRWESF